MYDCDVQAGALDCEDGAVAPFLFLDRIHEGTVDGDSGPAEVCGIGDVRGWGIEHYGDFAFAD